MAQISSFWFFRHLRAEMSAHVVRHRSGKVVASGRGLSFWFLPHNTSISEVPMDDRDQQVLFKGRTADFQEVVTQGILSWRVRSPERLAERIDLTLDVGTGRWAREPLQQIAQLLVELAQQEAWAYVAHHSVDEVLRQGVDALRTRLTAALSASEELDALGIEVVTVRVSSVRPTAELEKALQTPAREAIQQTADKAKFERRARAVDQERSIAENELHNKIELAKREEELIGREGANAQRRAQESNQAERLQAEGEAQRAAIKAESQANARLVAARVAAQAEGLASEAKASTLRQVGEARAAAERALMASYQDVPQGVLLALAAQDLAKNLPAIGHLNLTPDLVSSALAKLTNPSVEGG